MDITEILTLFKVSHKKVSHCRGSCSQPSRASKGNGSGVYSEVFATVFHLVSLFSRFKPNVLQSQTKSRS